MAIKESGLPKGWSKRYASNLPWDGLKSSEKETSCFPEQGLQPRKKVNEGEARLGSEATVLYPKGAVCLFPGLVECPLATLRAAAHGLLYRT